jgi:hypothetical protein
MMPQKYIMTVEEVRGRLAKLTLPGRNIPIEHPQHNVYGVPNGGWRAALYLTKARIVTNILHADIILDDIIDSGETRDLVMGMPEAKGRPFVALVDFFTHPEDRDLGWIVFPWESPDDPAQKSGLNVVDRIRAEIQQGIPD